MILYFTGTGNSRHIARHIADHTGNILVDLVQKLKENDTNHIDVNGPLILVTPTYAWRIPRIVEQWLRRTELRGVTAAWFVMTCGSEIGNAAKYNQQLCQAKGFKYMGTAQVVMPENYIAMFNAPDAEAAQEIVAKANTVLDNITEKIAAGKAFSLPRNNAYDRLMSGPVNGFFYRFSVKADPFTAKDACIHCGKCTELCPLNNIRLVDGKPVWGKNCTHCMACICYCPTEAIEYGKKSVGKPRYHLE